MYVFNYPNLSYLQLYVQQSASSWLVVSNTVMEKLNVCHLWAVNVQ